MSLSKRRRENVDNEKMVKYIGVGCAIVFALCLAWYLLREPDVHDQRERSNDVIESLGRAGSEQQSAKESVERIGRELDDSIKRTDEIAERISDAENAITASQERSAECAGIVRDSESRIAESRAILQRVRGRAQ